MKHCLLLCVAVLALAAAVPASAQYVYLDVNGDGICDGTDVLTSSVTSIDVYFDTNHNADGSDAVCPSGEALTINSYTFILSSTGGVTYGAWTDDMGFTINAGGASAGNDMWLARASGTPSAPGHYKVGSLAVTVVGTPVISLLATDPPLDGTALTSFGSQCVGQDFDNTMKLGQEFTDHCATSPGTPVTNKTWGQIKALYQKGGQ